MLKRTSLLLSALLVMSLLLSACGPFGGDDNGDDDAAPPQQEETPAEGETPEDEDGEETPAEEEDATPEGDETPEATETEEEAAETPEGEVADGETIFLRECAACHGEDGEGNERNGSRILPHAGNPLVTAEDPIGVISVVLTGRGGMPRFDGVLSDEEIAAVISYIRTAWDNDASEIDAGQVDEIRQEVIPNEGDGAGDETQGAGDQDEDDSDGTPTDDEESEDGATPTEESDDEN